MLGSNKTSPDRHHPTPPALYIEKSPEFPVTSSNISVACYSCSRKQTAVPCRYRWYRSKNGVTTELTNVKGATYMCEPGDIGATISADIKSTDQRHSGSTVVQFGPVKMDVVLKNSIERILVQGRKDFGIHVIYHQQARDAQLSISEAAIKLKAANSDRQLKLDFTVGNPAMEMSTRDPSCLFIQIPSCDHPQLDQFMHSLGLKHTDKNSRIELKFHDRQCRDTFVFSYKAFAAKKDLKTAHIVNSLEQSTKGECGETFNYLLQMESLRFDLYRLIVANAKLSEEKQFYQNEVSRLEEEMTSVRNTYSKLLQQYTGISELPNPAAMNSINQAVGQGMFEQLHHQQADMAINNSAAQGFIGMFNQQQQQRSNMAINGSATQGFLNMFNQNQRQQQQQANRAITNSATQGFLNIFNQQQRQQQQQQQQQANRAIGNSATQGFLNIFNQQHQQEQANSAINRATAQNFANIFNQQQPGLTIQQACRMDHQAAEYFLNILSKQQQNIPQQQSISPQQQNQLDNTLVKMMTSVMPPPQQAPLQIQQLQSLDWNSVQSIYYNLYQQNMQLRTHINKLSCQVAWFYSQNGQPSLPQKLKYRLKHQAQLIPQEPQLEKTKCKYQIEQMMRSLNNQSFSGIREVERLNESLSKLLKENQQLIDKNQSQNYRIGHLEDTIKRRENDSRLALNRIQQLNGVVITLQQFIFKLRNPSGPCKIDILYNGQRQVVPFKAHEYAVDYIPFKQVQTLKSRVSLLIQQKAQLAKLKDLAAADTVILQMDKTKLESSVRQLQQQLGKAEDQLASKGRKMSKMEAKMAEIIAEHSKLIDRRRQQVTVKYNHTLQQKDQELARITTNLNQRDHQVAHLQGSLLLMQQENQRLASKVESERVEFQKTRQQNDLLKQELLNLKDQAYRVVHEKDELVKAKLLLTMENENLLKQHSKNKKKMEEINEQNKLLKKSQDVMNKSRDLCSQMDSFYVEENDLIKQQYDMLKEEHDKLVSMCEKYHSEAKESLRLRQQIVHLKEQLKGRYPNPQNLSMSIHTQ